MFGCSCTEPDLKSSRPWSISEKPVNVDRKQQVARSSDYLDGQLTFRERLLVRHHLLFCPNCRRFIKQMRLLGATLKNCPRRHCRSGQYG